MVMCQTLCHYSCFPRRILDDFFIFVICYVIPWKCSDFVYAFEEKLVLNVCFQNNALPYHHILSKCCQRVQHHGCQVKKNLKCRIYSNFCSGEEATGCLPLGTICHSPSTTGLYFWISSTFWRFLPTQVQAHCLLHCLLWLRAHHPLLCHETPAA